MRASASPRSRCRCASGSGKRTCPEIRRASSSSASCARNSARSTPEHAADHLVPTFLWQGGQRAGARVRLARPQVVPDRSVGAAAGEVLLVVVGSLGELGTSGEDGLYLLPRLFTFG